MTLRHALIYPTNYWLLGTNTLGDVNFKILTTVIASIEEFRKKIDTELNIRTLWGSKDIEQSIQNICTLSYASEPHGRHSPASARSHGQGAHSGHEQTHPIYGAIPPHNLKEPYSVQAVYPPRFVPLEGPVTPRSIADSVRSEDQITPQGCHACGHLFRSVADLQTHRRGEYCAGIMTSSLSAHRGSVQRENPQEQSQTHFYQLEQQKQSAT